LNIYLLVPMWSNFHTHSDYCDGKGSIESYLDAARRMNVQSIGFSSHAPLPFPSVWCMKATDLPLYLKQIESLKPRFPELEIYSGLEIDYIPERISPADFSSRLDYTIGSIHFVDSDKGVPWEIDNTLEVFRKGLTNIFQHDIRNAIARYFQLTREMIARTPPDIVGHLDKIKIHNSQEVFFEESEAWYRSEIDRTIEAIRYSQCLVEVNTRGLYKKKSPTTYPSPWILERILDAGIPITMNSDAHHPEDLVRKFEPTLLLLKDIGFRKLSILKNGIWTEVPLNEYGHGH
jgi:histidinol-phosphatase (PHP family)